MLYRCIAVHLLHEKAKLRRRADFRYSCARWRMTSGFHVYTTLGRLPFLWNREKTSPISVYPIRTSVTSKWHYTSLP